MAQVEAVMLSVLEIYRAAQATISRYRDEAGIHAAQRADEQMAATAGEIKAVWRWIKRRL